MQRLLITSRLNNKKFTKEIP